MTRAPTRPDVTLPPARSFKAARDAAEAHFRAFPGCQSAEVAVVADGIRPKAYRFRPTWTDNPTFGPDLPHLLGVGSERVAVRTLRHAVRLVATTDRRATTGKLLKAEFPAAAAVRAARQLVEGGAE